MIQFDVSTDSTCDLYREYIERRNIWFAPLCFTLEKDGVQEEFEDNFSCYQEYVDFYKKDLDYRGNVYNKDAQNFYSKCNCKILEPAFEKTRPNRQVEIMRTKHCIKYALGICKSPQKLILVDEKGIKFPLKFDCKNCEMVILSPIK